MKPREGVYYAGWMFGIIVTVFVCRLIGLHQIAGLVIGLVVGLGFGIVAEKVYDRFFGSAKPPKQPPGGKPIERIPDQRNNHERGCPNLKCNWYGDTRQNMHCPKCNERLDNPYRSPMN